MYLADYHVHSTCSQDGRQTMAQAAQAAVAAGMDELCLTDHVDTVYWGPEQKPRWDFDWDAVRRQFCQAQEQWGHRITLRLGAELGEAAMSFQRAEHLMQNAPPLDFVIGSVHMAGKKFHHKDLYYIEKADEAYYDSIIDSYLEDVLAEHPEAVVIPVKLRDGTVTYDTQTAARDTVTTGGPETLTSLKTLLSGDTWTVARIACFADMDFANAQPDQAGLLRTGDGWLWYDDDAACWLDPGKAAAREYLVQLCKECAELGFDEILLDYCTYPVHGRLDRIDYGSVTNLTDTLSVFVEGVREALPKTTALSVLVRDQVTADANDGGVTLALLTEHFDRIYVDTDTVDAAALQKLLPADFDPVTRLVQVAAESASSGSYVTR